MNIHSIYRFKLTDSANKIYRYYKKANSYNEFEGVETIQLIPLKGRGSIKSFQLVTDTNQVAVLKFTNPSFGNGVFKTNDDLLLVKNSISTTGFLKIIIFKNMRPYSSIIYQAYLAGYFRPQIKALRKSFIR